MKGVKMSAIPVTLDNGKYFKNKTACTKYFSIILKHNKLNKKVKTQFHDDVMSLFRRHPKYTRLKESIKFVYVGKDIYGYRCFFVKLHEGVDSFSIKKCINSKDDSNFVKFQQACRNAVIDQIIHFKKSNKVNGRFISAISEEIIPEDKVHVDHKYQFLNMVEDFISKYHIDIDSTEFNSDIPMSMTFKKEEINKQFYDFHKTYAVLRIVSETENLSRKKPKLYKELN